MSADGTPKDIVRRFILEGMDNVDESIIKDLCADEVALLGRAGALPSELILEQTRKLYDAYSDFSHEIIDIWEDDGKVTVQYKNTGTFDNTLHIEGDPMFGDLEVEPTGDQVEYYGVYLIRVEDGSIVEWMNYSERLQWLQQIGVLPEMDELTA